MQDYWTSRKYKKEEKIYRGSFNFIRNENIYAEELFDVYRDKRDQTLHYISESIVKITTGEILNIHVEYNVNKDYTPLYVNIHKIMGKENTSELYEFNIRKNQLMYHYTNTKGVSEITEIPTAPKFHIATPTAASSMIFLRSKKFDTNTKNPFNLLVSPNTWDFVEFPSFKNVLMERAGLTAEKINIEGQNVQAIQYRIFDENVDFKTAKLPPHIRVYLSPHGSIPYIIRTEDGTKIQIKYLNDLADKE